MDTENSVSSLSLALEQQDLLAANHLSSSLSKHFHLNSYAAKAGYPHEATFNKDINDCTSDFKNLKEFNYDVAQKLFSQISQNDQHTREIGIDALENAILTWANKQNCLKAKQKSNKVLSENNNISENSIFKDEMQENKDITSTLMQKALASLSRFHICCPFPDVRNRCEQILTKLQVSKIKYCSRAEKIGSDILLSFDKLYYYDFIY